MHYTDLDMDVSSAVPHDPETVRCGHHDEETHLVYRYLWRRYNQISVVFSFSKESTQLLWLSKLIDLYL